MKLGIVIYSSDPETVWNAFRLGNFALAMGDEVAIFLLGKGVEYESLGTDIFNITEQVQPFINNNGRILACGTCLEIRGLKPSKVYTVGTLKDIHEIVKKSDRIVTF